MLYGNDIGLEVDFGSAPTWDHNLLFANGIDYDGIADLTGLFGNLAADPLFVDPLGDFRRRAGSPAIDAGSPFLAPLVDFAGASRPVDGNGDLIAAFDMGAFESRQVPEPRSLTLVSLGSLILSAAGLVRQRFGTPRRR